MTTPGLAVSSLPHLLSHWPQLNPLLVAHWAGRTPVSLARLADCSLHPLQGASSYQLGLWAGMQQAACLRFLGLAVVTPAGPHRPALSSLLTGPSVSSESSGPRGGAGRGPLAGGGRKGSQALVSKLGESSSQGL